MIGMRQRQDVEPPRVQAGLPQPLRQGRPALRAEATLGRSFHVRGDITIQGSAYAHIWKDSDGAELTASIGAHIDVPEGSLFVLIPPKDLHFDAGATLGKFRGGSQTYRGIKFSITYHIETFFHNFNGSYSAFIDDSGHVHLDADNYTLIDAGNNVGYLLANLPDGSALARRVQARVLAAPLHSRELETTLRILPGQRDGVFTLYWCHGAPRLTLIAPDGTRYAQGDPRVPTFAVGQGRAGDGYRGGVAIVPPALTSGTWTVRIDNLHGNEGYKLTVTAANPRPLLRVTALAGGQTAVANPFVTVAGTLSSPTTANSVSLYYTNQRTVVVKSPDGHLSTVPNLGGAALAEGMPVHNGMFSYRWNTAAFPRGVYYVYAVLDNGISAEVASYTRGRIVVRQPSAPGAPRNVVATVRGNQLHILWTPPAHSSILAGYTLHWRTNDMPAGTTCSTWAIYIASTSARIARACATGPLSAPTTSPTTRARRCLRARCPTRAARPSASRRLVRRRARAATSPSRCRCSRAGAPPAAPATTRQSRSARCPTA